MTASNSAGAPATQALVLTVNSSPVITSAATTMFTVGQAGTFTVTTVATPAVTDITRTGTLPAGVTFVYNNNGTATLAGTPGAGTGGSYPQTFTATNGVGTPGVQNFTLNIAQPPDAQNDTYNGGVGNTQYSVGAGTPATPAVVVAGSVLGNDQGTALPLTTAVTVAPLNGQVVMSTTGTFLYTPAAGYAGPSDAFTYSVTDANGMTDTAVVTINMSGLVWYVGASVTNGDGRSHNPFNSIANAQAAVAAGQTLYVGSGPLPGDVVLRANEVVRGAGAAFTVNALTLPAGTSPVLSGTLTLANGVDAAGVSVNGGAGPAIVGSGITTTATLTAVSVVGGTTGVLINGGTGTLDLGAAIANTGGRQVDVQNRTAGAVNFLGPITNTSGSGTGIFLNANGGSVIAFTGGVALATGDNDAFTATGGGTVTATQNNTTIVNTLSVVNGTALRVENTEIGAAGLTFRSISSGTPVGNSIFTSGVGVVLQNTGLAIGNGGLTVTGIDLVADSGGAIRRKTGADGLLTEGVGIYLENTKAPSFNRMRLETFDNSGIVARNVAGFLLANSVVRSAGNAAGEGPIVFGAAPAPRTGWCPAPPPPSAIPRWNRVTSTTSPSTRSRVSDTGC